MVQLSGRPPAWCTQGPGFDPSTTLETETDSPQSFMGSHHFLCTEENRALHSLASEKKPSDESRKRITLATQTQQAQPFSTFGRKLLKDTNLARRKAERQPIYDDPTTISPAANYAAGLKALPRTRRHGCIPAELLPRMHCGDRRHCYIWIFWSPSFSSNSDQLYKVKPNLVGALGDFLKYLLRSHKKSYIYITK